MKLYDLHSDILKHIHSRYNVELLEIKGAKIYSKFKNGSKYKEVFEYIANQLASLKSTKVIVIAVDKNALYIDVVKNTVIKKIDEILRNIDNPYAIVLKLKASRSKLLEKFERDLRDVFSRFQIMNEVLYCLNKFLSSINSYGYIVFDSDAKTIQESLYGFIGKTLTIEGVATVRGLENIQHINLVLLGDSKLLPGLQFSDIIAYCTHRALDYKEYELLKYFKELFKRVATEAGGRIWVVSR